MAGSIEIQGLRVRRGDFVLSDITLSVAPGEIFAILGRTGSGKTVLFESIAGAFEPEAGTILLSGVDASQIPVRERKLGIVYQDYALFPHLSVFENVAFGLRRARVDKDDITRRVTNMLERFGISHIAKKRPGVISGGEAQRTSLARALVLEPQILLLDEPFSALDPATKNVLYDLVREVRTQLDCTVVFVTHDFNEAQVLADRVAILVDGRLLAYCRANELFEAEFPDEVMHFLGRNTGR